MPTPATMTRETGLHVAIIRQRYNAFGGAERFIERTLQALGREGVRITVIARDWSGPRSGSDWLRCDPRHVGRAWRDASFRRAACALVLPGRFHLVQSHERLSCCDVYRAGDGVHAQWLANRSRAGSAWMRVATALSPYHRQLLAAERRMFASPRLRAVICNSRMVREEIQRWFGVSPERLHVIYNGVDLEHFHPRLAEVHRGSMRRSLGIGEHERLVLFVGNGFQRKGLPQLLRALALLPTHVHLAVVGEDRARAPLESLSGRLGLDRRVHWIGGQGDVRPWYAAGDVLALPTLYDPFPNVVLESLACGLPVVTSGTCGAAEIILDGKNGIVCPDALDIESLATALERTASAGEAWRAAARASAEPFSIERTARDLVGLYRGLLGEGALAASGK